MFLFIVVLLIGSLITKLAAAGRLLASDDTIDVLVILFGRPTVFTTSLHDAFGFVEGARLTT